MNEKFRLSSAAAGRPPQPAPAPPWALGIAILLGVFAALLPGGSAPHVHHGDLATYVHSHSYLGAHTHSHQAPEKPLPPEPRQGGDSVALSLALSLAAPLPALLPAPSVPPPSPAAAAPQLPRSAEPASPGAPRGPPPTSC